MSTERPSTPGTVWVVHCIDTEGPLEEPLDATFVRINARFGLSLEPSTLTLKKIQRCELDLGGREEEIARFVSPGRLAYLSTWREVEAMIERVTSPEFRNQYTDSLGRPYVFSWFILDVVGCVDNPRRKAAGVHAIWDQYHRFLRMSLDLDCLGWHFHAVPVGGHALEYNTCWTNNDYHEQVLARRLLERRSFPALFRAGGLIERNDLSLWLEQFIPFDYSSAAMDEGAGRPGRLWDWRHAPQRWRPYHPDWYDYRRPGKMRRSVFRCLEINGYEYVMKKTDITAAFDEAQAGRDVVLAYTSHDRRDLKPDVELAVSLLREVATHYPRVSWQFTNALEAARKVLGHSYVVPPTFTYCWKGDVLWIESDQELFGPAPFVAVEEEGKTFFRDNPTIEGPRQWAYVPPRLRKTRRIGFAGSNPAGATGMTIVDI